MSTFCVLKNKRFKDKAALFNVSESTLEFIIHKYINELQDPELFPSDSYIARQIIPSNIVSENILSDAIAVYNKYFKYGFEGSLKEAKDFRNQALQYFDEEAVKMYLTSLGSYKVVVGKPQAANKVQRKKTDNKKSKDNLDFIESIPSYFNSTNTENKNSSFSQIKTENKGLTNTEILQRVFKRFGDVNNLKANIDTVNKELVDVEEHDKVRKDDKTKSNKTLRVYLKDHNKGYFELVKDDEYGYYSVHFKTAKEGSEYNSKDTALSTNEDRKILFLELIKLIPKGAVVSTHGEISEDGIKALNNIGRNMVKAGERTVHKKGTGKEVKIPIFLNVSEGSVEYKIASAVQKIVSLSKKVLDNSLAGRYNRNLQKQQITELDEYLKRFAKELGITVEEEDASKMSTYGSYYTIQQLIQIAKTGQRNALTLPEEFAHAFITMMGKNTEEYKQLFNSVEKTSLYKLVFDKYSKLKEYQNEDGTPNIDKLKNEAIGQALALGIVNEWKHKSTTKDKSFWQKLKDWFFKFLDKVRGINNFNGVINNLSKAVLNGDVSLLSGSDITIDEIYHQIQNTELSTNSENKQNVKFKGVTFDDFNEGQKKATLAVIQHIQDVLQGKKKNKIIRVVGAAGTGKTTIVNEIIKRAFPKNPYFRPTVVIGALSDLATKVIKTKVSDAGDNVNIISATVAAMLGRRETPNGWVVDDTVDKKFNAGSFIIIDEASMLNENDKEQIDALLKNVNKPVLVLGDKYQLPSIRVDLTESQKKKLQEKFPDLDIDDIVSPFFYDDSIDEINLTEIVRQGADSPILEYTYKYKTAIDENTKESYPVDVNEKSVVTDDGAIIFHSSEANNVHLIADVFRQAAETANPNLIRVVTYTRNDKKDKISAVTKWNTAIRKELFPNADKLLVAGDLVKLHRPFNMGDFFTLGKSTEGILTKVGDIQTYDCSIIDEDLEPVQYVETTLHTNDGDYLVKALYPSKENMSIHNNNLQILADKAKKNRKLWSNFYRLRDKVVAQLDYNYAISSHSSEGSTYEVCVVDLSDINSVQVNLSNKARSAYTALTRAANVVVCISNTTNENRVFTNIADINTNIKNHRAGIATENFVPEITTIPVITVSEETARLTIAEPYSSKSRKSISVMTAEEFMDSINEPATIDESDFEDSTYRNVDLNAIMSEIDDNLNSMRHSQADRGSKTKTQTQTKVYNDLVAQQQARGKQVKFIDKNSEGEDEHTYTVNGKQVDYSVTQFKELVLGSKYDDSNAFHIPSTVIGSSHDKFLRDFFSDNILNGYKNFTGAQITRLRKEAEKLKNEIEKKYGKGCKYIADENLLRVAATVSYKGKNFTIAGTIDMLVVTPDGKIVIVDFKTKRANIDNKLDAKTEKEYNFQTAMYGEILGMPVEATYYAKFDVKYTDPSKTVYSKKNDSLFLNENGKKINIKNSKYFSTGTFDSFVKTSYNFEDVEVYSIKPILSSVQQLQKVKQTKTKTEPQRHIVLTNKHRTYGILDFTSDRPFTDGKHYFKNVAQYVAYMKALNINNAAERSKYIGYIFAAKTGALAKRYLNLITLTKAKLAQWNKIEKKIYISGIRKSLDQNQEALDLLLSTGSATISEYDNNKLYSDTLTAYRDEALGIDSSQLDLSNDKKSQKEKTILTTVNGKTIKLIGKKHYTKDTPTLNKNVAFVYTENALAAHAYDSQYDNPVSSFGLDLPMYDNLKLNVTATNNQSGIRTDRNGNKNPNTFGIVVKKMQQDENGRWLQKEGQFQDTDNDFILFSTYNTAFVTDLLESKYKEIVFPNQIALGKSALPLRFAKDLQQTLKVRLNIITKIKKNTTAGYDGYGLEVVGTTNTTTVEDDNTETQENESEQRESKPKFSENPKDFTVHSGGAEGSDMFFEKMAEIYGIDDIQAHSFYMHNTTSNHQVMHKKLELEEANDAVNEVLEKQLKGKKGSIESVNDMKSYTKKLIQRDYFQVKDSDVVYAVGTFKNGVVDGGTAYAVYMAINMGKPVYFFNQNENKWYKSTEKGGFKKISYSPKLATRFAGIGTRKLNDAGKIAIDNLFKKTFDEVTSPEEKQLIKKISEVYKEHSELKEIGTQTEYRTFLKENNLNKEESIYSEDIAQQFKLYLQDKKQRFHQESLERIQAIKVEEAIENKVLGPVTYSGDIITLEESDKQNDLIPNGTYTLSVNEDNPVQETSEIKKTIESMPFSSMLELNTDEIGDNLLQTLDYLLDYKEAYPIWNNALEILVSDEVAEKIINQYPNLRFDKETNTLTVPKFTIGFTIQEIIHRKQRENLLNSNIIKTSQLRSLSKAAIFKASEIITTIQSTENGYEFYFGDENNPNDPLLNTDFSKMSRIEIVLTIGLSNILEKVRERIFNTNVNDDRIANMDFDNLDKLDFISDNWNAFIQLGYDYLLNKESIAINENGVDITDIQERENDIITDEEKDEIQEVLGDSFEGWQINFRNVSTFSSLSQLVKSKLNSLYELDLNGNQIIDEFGLAKTLNAQEATAVLLNELQECRTIDDMVNKIKQTVEYHPWMSLLVDILEDKYDDEGNLISKSDEQFKTQFYTNFRKYFQTYAVTFKRSNGSIEVKIINEKEAGKSALQAVLALEENALVGNGKFKLRNKEGINERVFNRLRDLYELLKELNKKIQETRKKDITPQMYELLHELAYKIIDMLDIQAPVEDDIIRIFSTKKNINEFTKQVDFIIRGIEKTNEKLITDLDSYANLVNLLYSISDQAMESVTFLNGKMYYSYILPNYLTRLTDKLSGKGMSDWEFTNFLQKEYLYTEWFNKKGVRCPCKWLYDLMTKKSAREAIKLVSSLSYLDTQYVEKTSALYIASMFKMYFYDKSGNYGYFRVPIQSNKPTEDYIRFTKITKNYKQVIADEFYRMMLLEMDRIQAVRERNGKIEGFSGVREDLKIVNFDIRGEQFCNLDFLQKYLDGSYTDKNIYIMADEVSSESISKEDLDTFHRLLNKKLDTGSLSPTENSKFINLADKVIKAEMEDRFIKEKESWEKEGFIKREKVKNKNGEEVEKITYQDNMKLTDSDLEEFFWNDTFAASLILQLTITDQAYYKNSEDLQKRLALLHAPGIQANIYAKDFNGELYTADGVERTMYIADDEIISDSIKNVEKAFDLIIEEYADYPELVEILKQQKEFAIYTLNKVNVTDAQGYSCPTSYRKKKGVFGEWSQREEFAYQVLLHPEAHPDVNITDIIDVLMQPMKPFVYTQIQKNGHNSTLTNLKVGVQNKNSEYVLLLADALMRRLGINSKLSAIYDFMEDSLNTNGKPNGFGIDTIQFESCVKTGLTGVININFSEDKFLEVLNRTINGKQVSNTKKSINGIIALLNRLKELGASDKYIQETIAYVKDISEDEIKAQLSKAYTFDENNNSIYDTDYVHEIPFTDYMELQNVPVHYQEHTQIMGSQNRILAITDIENTEFVNGQYRNIQLDINGETYTMEQAKYEYMNAIAENIQDSFEILARSLGFKQYDTDKRVVNKRISKLLKEAILKDGRCGFDLLWACDVNEFGEFNIPLSDPVHSNRIQMLLNSIIKSRINKQMIEGGPIVQVSSWGTSEDLNLRFKDKDDKMLLTEKEFYTEKFPSDYGDNYLSKDGYTNYKDYIKNQSSIAYMECYMPIQQGSIYEDFLKTDENGNEYVDVKEIEKVNPDLLYMVGYRIPTESKYSMIPLKIKGFLPNNAGEAMMPPKEITALAGSDFDIDKNYIQRYTLKRIVDKNGNVKYVRPKEGRAYRNNLLIDIQRALLSHPTTSRLFLTPGNFEEVKKHSYLLTAVQQKIKELQERGEEVDAEKIYNEYSKLSVVELKDLSYESKNLMFSSVLVQFHKQNMVAGKLIGIFALANVSHGFMSLYEPSMFLPEGVGFTLNGIDVSDEVYFDDVYAIDGITYISSNLAQLLAASVDAVKDPILNLININPNSVNIVISLLRLGFSLKTVSLICSLKVFIDILNKAQTQKYPNLSKIISEQLKTFPSDYQSIKNIELTDNNLIQNLGNEDITTNYMILSMLKSLCFVSENLRDVSFMTRYNSISSAVGPSATDTGISLIQRNKALNNESLSEETKAAFQNPILKAFRQYSYAMEAKMLGNNIIQASSRYRNTLKEVSKRMGFENGLPSRLAHEFENFYMAYHVNTTNGNRVFDLSYNERNYMINQFPNDFITIQLDYKDNNFIRAIRFKKDKDTNLPTLELNTRRLNAETMEDLKTSWEQLAQSENKNDRALAIRLAEYCFFRDTFGFSPLTFSNLMPSAVKQILNGYITSLNNVSGSIENGSEEENRLINQFILHHPENFEKITHKLDIYNPTRLNSGNIGIEITPVDKKGREIKTTMSSIKQGLFITVGLDSFYVVQADNEHAVLKEIESLGGNGLAIEIDPDTDFPKSIFTVKYEERDEMKTDDEDVNDATTITDESVIGVLMDKLFEDDESFEKVTGSRAKSAIEEINQALNDRGCSYRVSKSSKTVKDVMNLLYSLDGVKNPREVLNKAQQSLEDLNLCF